MYMYLFILQTSHRCRKILCSSGKIRTRTGCKVPITSWFVGLVSLNLRLNYPDSQDDNILTLVQQGIVKQTDMKTRFLKKNPWPSLWKIINIAHTDEAYPEKKSIFILIVSETNSPAVLFRSIKNSIDKQWTANLNGSSINFKQSILEYTKTNKNGNLHVFHNERLSVPLRLL